jgi:hypothetical protein
LNVSEAAPPGCTAVFAGMDYHKKFSVVTLGDAGGKVSEQFKLPNEEKKLRQFFRKHSGYLRN